MTGHPPLNQLRAARRTRCSVVVWWSLHSRSRPPLDDPARTAALIIASVDQDPAPLWLVLGSDSYRFITGPLSEQLAEIELQREGASSTDVA